MDVSKISMEKIEIAVKDFNQEVYWRNENIKKYGEPFGMFIKIVYDKEIKRPVCFFYHARTLRVIFRKR